MKLKYGLPLILVLAALGCVSSSGPPGNTDFAAVSALSDLQGWYRNRGEVGETGQEVYLSRIIWPDATVIDHESTDLVQVERLDDATLRVSAWADDRAVRQDRFRLGEEFSLDGGRILLLRRRGLAGLRPEEPLLGLYSSDVAIGIDLEGHGKYRSSESAVGMAYLVVPVAIKVREDVRFERIERE